MNPIPFGAPEDAYDSSADNYLTECAGCHEPAMRDDLDEDGLCDACVALGEHVAIILTARHPAHGAEKDQRV